MSSRRTRVYIAGPYTRGDTALNVRAAMLAWAELWALGYAPFCPHLTHFLHLLVPHGYEEWLAYDLEWLRACDAVLRLPGESKGADRETAEARRLGLPVFGTSAELVAAVPATVVVGDQGEGRDSTC